MFFLLVDLKVRANNVLPGAQSSIVPDGTLLTTVCETGTVFKITGGEKKGINLFHSFDRFSVQTGKIAIFSNDHSGVTENIISRVTGNIRSEIDGIIRANKASGFANANFFLLNPAGITLGSGAELQIEGSVHLSTADSIRLEDGNTFYVDPGSASTLTTANVSAFGFLKPTDNMAIPSSISIEENSTLKVEEAETLSLVGGDITIEGANLKAPGGKIKIVSAAYGEEVTLEPSSYKTDEFSTRGEISIDAGQDTIGFLGAIPNPTMIDVASDNIDSGSISIRGGIITIDKSKVLANSSGDRNAGNITLDINELSMQNGARVDVGATGTGITGNVAIYATNNVKLTGRGLVETSLFAQPTVTSITASNSGNQNAGNITIDTPKLSISENAQIITSSSGIGSAGNIVLNVKSLTINSAGNITASTSNAGPGGNITINGYNGAKAAENINIIKGEINTKTDKSGDGGDILIFANNVNIDEEGSIISDTTFQGQGGSITIAKANSINVTGEITTDTTADPEKVENTGNAHAGIISLQTNTLRVQNSGVISSSSSNAGKAGNIEITANDQAVISSGGKITTDTTDKGNAGNVILQTNNLLVQNGGEISSKTSNEGDAGTIEISASDQAVISNSSKITTETSSSGKAGNVTLQTNKLLVQSGGVISSKTSATGGAGEIKIENAQLVDVSGAITTDTSGNVENKGKAGNVTVETNQLLVQSDGVISSKTSTKGNAGNINIENAQLVDVSGSIATDTDGTVEVAGIAGEINLQTNTLRVHDGGEISSRTSNDGNAGLVTISANDQAVITDGGKITTATTATASNLVEKAGNAGNVKLQTNTLRVQNSGVISSSSSNAGKAGNIEITAKNQALLSNKGSISSRSDGSGNAGNIDIRTTELRLDNSSITTEATQADGGNINIEGNSPAKLVSLKNNSAITATVDGGPQTTGGNINIDSDFIVLQNSRIIAEAFEGTGGNISIKTLGLFVDPESRISASSQLGVDGTVEIDSVIEVIDGVLGLPEAYLANVKLRQETCAQRLGGGKTSSFTIMENPGMPIGPEDLLSGDYSKNQDAEKNLVNAQQDTKNLVSIKEQYDIDCQKRTSLLADKHSW